MLYAADVLALAVLEVLVHVSKEVLPDAEYVWSKGLLPADPGTLTTHVHDEELCRVAGTAWIATRSALAVRVPSVFCPEHFNVLLNPHHPSYSAIPWAPPVPFTFDRRLFVPAGS